MQLHHPTGGRRTNEPVTQHWAAHDPCLHRHRCEWSRPLIMLPQKAAATLCAAASLQAAGTLLTKLPLTEPPSI